MKTHKSFRLTPVEQMRGSRVKPRLRICFYVLTVLNFAAVWQSITLGIKAAAKFGGHPLVDALLFCVVPVLVAWMCMFLCKRAVVLLHLMTREEAAEIPFVRWPESWLDPVDSQHDSTDSQEHS